MPMYKNPADGRYYRLKRACRLERCKIIIYTNREDHHFCEPNHQQEFWREERKRKRKIEAMVFDHEERIRDIEKNLEEANIRIPQMIKDFMGGKTSNIVGNKK